MGRQKRCVQSGVRTVSGTYPAVESRPPRQAGTGEGVYAVRAVRPIIAHWVPTLIDVDITQTP